MTQEELDKLMNGDMDDMGGDDTASADAPADEDGQYSQVEYDLGATKSWPPPPPLKENKVVHQLDDVTKESEEKATQMFDMLEQISNEQMAAEEKMASITETLASLKDLMSKLSAKFPQIETFGVEGEKIDSALANYEEVMNHLGNIGMNCMSAMDMMQYQDIHRQKIERVINIMRALSNYMNKLFEGKIEDEKRVSSAKHIHGDENNDVVGDDDIEALIAAFGQK
ncbi:MAG TPA: chemotaxis protein [Campylobacterales bacterium]|nr:chemotaxis protein [Campylobacterales bacterium]